MGFKTMPWMLYFKPSLKEFVIRQKNTVQSSANVKKIHAMLEAVRGTDNAPGKVAHEMAYRVGLTREKVVYVNGKREVRPVAYMPAFRAYLRIAMADVVVPVDEGVPTEKLHRTQGQRGIPREVAAEVGAEVTRGMGVHGPPASIV
jgi:hypothetical protein